MKKLYRLTGIMFLLCLLCCSSFLSVTEAADKEVSFKVTQVELSGSKVLLHGNFKNESEEFQKVRQLTVRYTLSDADGYPLLVGSCRGSDLDISVGSDKVPYTLTTENVHAPEFSSSDIAVWKISAHVETE